MKHITITKDKNDFTYLQFYNRKTDTYTAVDVSEDILIQLKEDIELLLFQKEIEQKRNLLDSPIEERLFNKLVNENIQFQVQKAITKDGAFINLDNKATKKDIIEWDIMTLSDFYISNSDYKLCIYTDGHTYHERTPQQAKHDRNIDRKLQEFGFTVLRFTSNEINYELDKVINQIKEFI